MVVLHIFNSGIKIYVKIQQQKQINCDERSQVLTTSDDDVTAYLLIQLCFVYFI